MKSLIFFFLITASLYAEKIGPVSYQMPTTAGTWVVGQKTENEDGTTILYIPEGIEKKEAKEFFGVNVNKFPTNVNDLAPLKEGLSAMMPLAKIEVWSLEKNKNDILYEWKATVDGKEKLHGWGRGFSLKDGTVLIGYQADNNVSMEYAINTWLPVLKQAKVN